jgi:hypothetical protein
LSTLCLLGFLESGIQDDSRQRPSLRLEAIIETQTEVIEKGNKTLEATIYSF